MQGSAVGTSHQQHNPQITAEYRIYSRANAWL